MTGTDFLTYRIMKGHLSFCRDGLSLYIEEPTPNMMFESISIYNEVYDSAYGNGVYIKSEILDYIYLHDFYSPFDDMEIKKLNTDMEDIKLACYNNYQREKELFSLKKLLRSIEIKISKINRKKIQFDHLTCEGVATHAQWNWIIENSTYSLKTGEKYLWDSLTPATLMSHYEDSVISSSDFRNVARSDLWRPIWNLGKKTGNLFDRPSSMLTRDQLALCSYSTMYDAVYESSDTPPEQVIEDDDCLDGWFIDQKRKNEKYKKDQDAQKFTSNKRIAKAGEVFVVASSDKEADYIDSLNSSKSKHIKKERMEAIKNNGAVTDMQFKDVAINMQAQQNENLFNKFKGK